MTLRKKFLAAVVAVVLITALSWKWWLPLPGEFLVNAGQPVKSDGIVVLAGDGFGNRVETAARLAREGYAPVVLVSGSDWFYGNCECDLAIDYAVRKGQPRELFIPFRMDATSTDEETLQILREAKRREWKTVLLVTSDYHTRRTGILAERHKDPSQHVTVVAAADHYFRPGQWWWHRESRKTVFMEWTKLVAVFLGGL